MYQLIIHHDVGVVNKGGNLEKEPTGLGHVYLELLGHEESVVYGIISGYGVLGGSYAEYRPHGRERLDLARKYEARHPGDKILHSKIINIKEIQYLEAMVLLDEYEQYIGKKMPSEIYGLLGNNCAHFVNHIYRSMGLEGYYTRHYRASELQSINTILTKGYKALNFYPGDKPFTVFGSSIEEVAKKYNVDVSKVIKKEITKGIPDMETAMIQEALDHISFEIAPNLELLGNEGDIFEQVKPESELKDQTVIFNYPNKVINHLAGKLLSDQNYAEQYRENSINDALSGLKLTESIIPGITKQSLKSANEHYELIQQLTGIKSTSEELEKVEKYEQEFEQIKPKMQSFPSKQSYNTQTQEKNSDDQDWLNDILSHTQTAMNQAYNDPDMQQFLNTLGNNSGFNFEDSI